MELTSKQRAQLRSMANDLDTIVHVEDNVWNQHEPGTMHKNNGLLFWWIPSPALSGYLQPETPYR